MILKIKIDEDLPKAVAESIRRAVSDTLTVTEKGCQEFWTLNCGKPFKRKEDSSLAVTKPLPISDNTHQEPTQEYYCSDLMKTVSCKCVTLSVMSWNSGIWKTLQVALRWLPLGV